MGQQDTHRHHLPGLRSGCEVNKLVCNCVCCPLKCDRGFCSVRGHKEASRDLLVLTTAPFPQAGQRAHGELSALAEPGSSCWAAAREEGEGLCCRKPQML